MNNHADPSSTWETAGGETSQPPSPERPNGAAPTNPGPTGGEMPHPTSPEHPAGTAPSASGPAGGEMLDGLLSDLGFRSEEACRAALTDALNELPERCLTVVALRYGLSDGRFRTLEQVGAAMPADPDSGRRPGKGDGISAGSARTIAAIGMARLRIAMESRLPVRSGSAPALIVV